MKACHKENFTSNVDLVLPNALAILLEYLFEYLFRLPCNPHVPFPCLHAYMQASVQSSIVGRGYSVCRVAWPASIAAQRVVTVTTLAAVRRSPLQTGGRRGRTALLVIYPCRYILAIMISLM